MPEHANVERLRTGYEAFAKGDLDKLRELWAPDIIWHGPPIGPLAGEYKGQDEVFGFFGGLVEQTQGTFKLEVLHLLADDQYGLAYVRATGERNGNRADQDNCHLFRFDAEGRVVEFKGFLEDPQQLIDFWS